MFTYNCFSTKITCWLATEYDKKETFAFVLRTLKLNKEVVRSRIFVTNPMTSMPNRIVLAVTALLSEEPETIQQVLEFLENFYENYFGTLEIKTFEDIKTVLDTEVSKKIMKYATHLDEPIVKEIMKENETFFSVYNDLDFDESILLSLNGNTLDIPIKDENVSDRLEELVSIELQERAQRMFQVAKEADESRVATRVLAYSFIERKLLELIDENLSNLVSISSSGFPQIQK